MQTLEEYKESLLAYLHAEQSMEENDIAIKNQMSREQKIDANMLLAGLTVKMHDGETIILNVPDNYTKLRAGDKVRLRKEGEEVKGVEATIFDAFQDTIALSALIEIEDDATYEIEEESPNLLQALIGCLGGIMEGAPGAGFLRNLSGEEPIEIEEFLKLVPEHIAGFGKIFEGSNNDQQEAIRKMLEFPPIHVLQGPPGTGKTFVLAATALATALANREVVIIANTHHAVNNALMAIRKLNKNVPLFKIGEELKAEELDNTIVKLGKFADFNEYSYAHRRKKKYGYVVGMTIWGAITHLGLRQHGYFRPYCALVDEASLMPLTYASILGKCAPSICLFGDSRQMPPIFRPELDNNKLSVSILDYCAEQVEGVPVSVLTTTFRMNKEITETVSKAFYEPHGITLKSADVVADNKFASSYFRVMEMEHSIVFMNPVLSKQNWGNHVSKVIYATEENFDEAWSVISTVKTLLDEGTKANDIAVITPFRKQVRMLKSVAQKQLADHDIPMIDTVERLQGQDVECIILSFASTDSRYIKDTEGFLFDKNRINVMISRAKTKVVIFAGDIVQKRLKELLQYKEPPMTELQKRREQEWWESEEKPINWDELDEILKS